MRVSVNYPYAMHMPWCIYTLQQDQLQLTEEGIK